MSLGAMLKPFEQAQIPRAETEKLRADLLRRPDEFFLTWIGPGYDPSKREEYITEIIDRSTAKQYWRNDKYQVAVFDAEVTQSFPAMYHLSIKRNDRAPIFNWRDLQAIKNAIIGPEHEGVQLFPAESRKVDGANQYHLFVLKDDKISFPFGFWNRAVTDQSVGGSVNRPIEEK